MSTDFVLMPQCVDGVGLCTRHNVHRTDYMKNGKQHTAYLQLTAWFIFVEELAPISYSQKLAAK